MELALIQSGGQTIEIEPSQQNAGHALNSLPPSSTAIKLQRSPALEDKDKELCFMRFGSRVMVAALAGGLLASNSGVAAADAPASNAGTDMKDKTATVTVQLEYFFPDGWKPVGSPGARSIPPDQNQKRANARVRCASNALGHWRSTVDVDIDRVIDSPGVLVTPEQVRPCRP
ncbi:hypothetical protein HUO13_32715 [Saccharopolyspora erythraea]|uniref:hypothetical protein n=1 Tax=Saccharopolyspora erythraea TaxID=1836 RepID=UPI001BA5BE2B|nr:hypothetical protein [Saccharopolyspora erythraea]QUH04908.1 hypothetical protein HUO13_32715 [Saccharopolyspora erythraea]